MISGRSMKPLLTLVVTVVFLALVGRQILPKAAHWNQRHLANQIAHVVEQGSQDIAGEPLERLSGMGAPALDSLVLLASSQRASIAQQARQALDQQFASWQTQSAVDSNFDLVTPTTALASALVNHADRLDVRGKRWASSLAIRMVNLSESLSSDEAAKLLYECERVLAAIPPQGPRLRSLPEPPQWQTSSVASRLDAPEVRIDLLETPEESTRELFFHGQKASPSGEGVQNVDRPNRQEVPFPKTAVSSDASDSKTSRWSPQWNSRGSTEETSLLPIESREDRLEAAFDRLGESTSDVVDVPTPQEMEQRQQALQKVPSRVLIAELSKAGHYDAGSIRVVLRQRGFTDAEWALAEIYSSPQIEDRKQLVEAVSVLPAENARRWLRWLLKDEAAEIRLIALTALATTNDPQLYRLARELALEDQDNRVSDLASRIMQQVR